MFNKARSIDCIVDIEYFVIVSVCFSTRAMSGCSVHCVGHTDRADGSSIKRNNARSSGQNLNNIHTTPYRYKFKSFPLKEIYHHQQLKLVLE